MYAVDEIPFITFLDTQAQETLWHDIKVFLVWCMPIALIAVAIAIVGLLIYVIVNAFRTSTGQDPDDYDEDYDI